MYRIFVFQKSATLLKGSHSRKSEDYTKPSEEGKKHALKAMKGENNTKEGDFTKLRNYMRKKNPLKPFFSQF